MEESSEDIYKQYGQSLIDRYGNRYDTNKKQLQALKLDIKDEEQKTIWIADNGDQYSDDGKIIRDKYDRKLIEEKRKIEIELEKHRESIKKYLSSKSRSNDDFNNPINRNETQQR